MLDKADKLGRFFENLLLSALLLGMIGMGTSQILLRWTGSGSIVWGDEAIRIMVLWIAVVAGVAAAREDRHISIDVLSRFLPLKIKAAFAVVVDLFTAGVSLVLAWYSWVMVSYAIEDGDLLLGGLVPAWWVQIILPAGFLLIGYRYLLWVGRRIVEALRSGAEA